MNKEILSIIIKIIVSICAVLGTILSALAGRNSFMGGLNVFLYFTIQSNLAVAIGMIVGLILMIKDIDLGNVSKIFKLVGTVSITLTGVVFCFVLAPTMKGNAFNIQNVLTHVIVPILSVIDLFIVGKNYKYNYYEIFYVLIPPLMYLVFASICYVSKVEFYPGVNYPYFFLNWGNELGAFGFDSKFPLMGCVWWILLLLLFLIGVGYLYSYLLKKIYKHID